MPPPPLMRSDPAGASWNSSAAWQRYVDVTFLAANCVILLGTSLVGVGANVFVTWAVYHQKSLRTWNNALLVNLAVIDLLRCAVDCPIILAIVLTVHRRGRAAGALCDLQMASFSFSCCIQLVTLACISAERYQAIAHPFKIAERKRRIVTFIPLTWTLAMAVAAVCVTFVKDSPVYVKCRGPGLEAAYGDTFGLYVLVPLWTACFALIIGFYASIFAMVTAHSRKIFDKGVNPPPKEEKKDKATEEAKGADETPEANKRGAADGGAAREEKVEGAVSNAPGADPAGAAQPPTETVSVSRAPRHHEKVAEPTTETDKPPDESLKKPPKQPNPEESNPKESNPKESNPKEPNPKESNPKEPNPKEPNPKEPNPKESNPKEPNPKEPNPKDTKGDSGDHKAPAGGQAVDVVSSRVEKTTPLVAHPVIQVQEHFSNGGTESHPQGADRAPGKRRGKVQIQESKPPAPVTVDPGGAVPPGAGGSPSREPGGPDKAPSALPQLADLERGSKKDEEAVVALATVDPGDTQDLCMVSVARIPPPDKAPSALPPPAGLERGSKKDEEAVAVVALAAVDAGDTQDLCMVSVARIPPPDKAPAAGEEAIGAVCMMPSKANKDRGSKKKESKLAKRSGYIILTFLLFWLPLITTILVNVLVLQDSHAESTIIQDVEILFISIACMTSLTDPIIYAAVNPQFRTEFYRLRNKVKSLWKKR